MRGSRRCWRRRGRATSCRSTPWQLAAAAPTFLPGLALVGLIRDPLSKPRELDRAIGMTIVSTKVIQPILISVLAAL